MKKDVSLDSYKGVRDFYPEDQFIQNYIFDIWKKTLKSFGYEQYDASILEPSNLYEAKTGEEIVNEQTYKFIDRGLREVTLRPEMTPTVARMVAKRKRELRFPLRWFSIPNLFRYERPQKGRLREHWQLNADFFGVENIEADIEVIEIAYNILKNFGLKDDQFEIKVNDRKLLNKYFEELNLNEIEAHSFTKLLDKKNKINDFDEQVEKLLNRKIDFEPKANETIEAVIDKLRNRQINNVVFDPTITRGFDYYTGIVFEIFDKHPENNRSLFGGGRYDDLLDIFDAEKIPAVGFGMGDVMLKETLATYNLLPEFKADVDLMIVPLDEAFYDTASDWALHLRDEGLNVLVEFSNKKAGDVIKKALDKKIPYISFVGEDEINKKKMLIKNLENRKEKSLALNKVTKFLKK